MLFLLDARKAACAYYAAQLQFLSARKIILALKISIDRYIARLNGTSMDAQ
jgi:hypothetical protein